MMVSSIPLRRRIEYARGYLELGMVASARDELKALSSRQRLSCAARVAAIDVEMQASDWKRVVDLASSAVRRFPTCERGWIAWAYALRELQRVEEARDVLLEGEGALSEESSLLHYNLACYLCLLGRLQEAEQRLARACCFDLDWRATALSDPDLAGLKRRLQATS